MTPQPDEERLRAILGTAREAIVTADASGHIVDFNPAAERMFGLSAADAMGASLTTLMPERFHAAHEAGLRRFLETRKPKVIGQTVELAGQRADGEEFPVELSLVAFELRGEVFFTGILSDITERKRAERERAAYRTELERSLAELEQFAYVASHDLQEPLRSIGGFARLLERRYEGKLDDEANRFIGLIVGGVDRMQSLIDDLLSYSRGGRVELRKERADAGEIVRTALGSLDAAVRETEAEIELGELPTISADPSALAQVFQNLISNAIKFNDSRPPRVDVSAEPGDAAWTFAVADNGIGVDPAQKQSVFGMFRRVHGSDDYGGTGIGLAICKRTIERHGGSIWCEPRPEGGTTFRFTIPDY